MRRREAVTPSGAIIGRDGAGDEPAPGAQDQQEFLALGEAGGLRAEDVEALPFQFTQQAPIDRAHQLSGDHGATVGSGKGLASQAIKMTSLFSYAGGEFKKARRIFQPQDLFG